MPETGNMVSRLLASIGIDYSPAILAGRQFAQSLSTVNAQLLALQRTARATGAALGTDMSSGIERSRIIYDQYGNVLKRVTLQQEQMIRESQKQAQITTQLATTRQRINEHFLAREQANLNQHLRQLENKERLSAERRLAIEAQYYARAERDARLFYQRQVGNFTEMTDQLERRMGWFWAGMAFYGAQDVFRRTVAAMGDVEMGMVELARIQDDVTFNFEEMRQSLMDLGKEYGQQWSVVQDIALRWSQAGLNVKETLEATRTSLLALNTAEMDAQQSTTSLIGIMAQWGLEVTDLLDVIDKINITADNFVVTSQDLIDGLLRSSGSARVLGMSLDETLAVLTAMQEASGRTGREVGNALNSIMSFMQRDIALNTFEAMGINVWADETKTQFRSLIEIFDQVAANWDTISDEIKDGFVAAANEAGLFSEEMAGVVGAQEEWNDLQKRDVSQAMAGVYRRNYLLALLQNWSTVQEVLNGLTEAQGYSLRENERTMEAYQKRVESLRMAVTELAVAIGDAGLLDIMKGLVDGTREAIEEFRQLPQPIQEAIITVVGLTAALAGINLTMRVFMGMGIGSVFIGLAARIAKVEAATLSLGMAFKLLATNPLVSTIAAVGALTAVAISYNKHQEKSSQLLQNSIQQHITAAKGLEDQANRIESLVSQYETLAEKTSLTTGEQEKLHSIVSDLVDIMPEVASGFDEAGRAITNLEDVSRAAANEVARLRSEMIEQAKTAAAIAQSALPDLRKEKAAADASRKRLRGALTGSEHAQSGLLNALQWGDITEGLGINVFGNKLFEQIDAFFFTSNEEARQIMRDNLKALNERNLALEEEMAAAEKAVNIYENLKKTGVIDGNGGNGGNTNNNKNNNVPNRTPTPNKNGGATPSFADQYREAANQAKLSTDLYNAALEELDTQLQSVFSRERLLALEMQSGTVPTTEQLQQKYVLLAETINLNTERQNTLRDAMKAAQGELAGLESQFQSLIQQHKSGKISTEDFNAAVSALRPTINELKSSVHQYENAWWDAEYNVKAAIQSMKQAQDDLARSAYENAMAIMRHEVAMARMSTQEQIKYLQEVHMARQWNTELAWQMEEEKFRLYRDALQEEMDAVRKAYDERLQSIQDEIDAEEGRTRKLIEQKERRIEAIDEETNARIAAIQKLIDALDIEGEQSDREEAERQHNQKIADLIDERQYHELRTGLEHQRKIAEINEQIAEEERAWKLQQEEWAREDQKQAYEDEIDAIEEQAKTKKEYLEQEIEDLRRASDEKKRELQDYYNEVQELLDSRTLDMLASLAATDEQWYERGVKMMRELARGIRDGSTELPSGVRDLVEDAEDAYDDRPTPRPDKDELTRQTPIATITSSQFINSGGRAYMSSRDLANELDKSVQWDNESKRVKIGSKWFDPWKVEGNKSYVGVREVAEAFGYRVEFKSGNIFIYPKAHTGAYVADSGVAELLKGERVLSPQMTVSFDRLANVLDNIPNIPDRIALMTQGGFGGGGLGVNFDMAVERIIAAIERRRGIQIQNLLNVEQADFSERDDMEIMSRELRYMVDSLRVAKGD